MENSARPLAVLLLNAALIVVAGLAGAVGMLVAGKWLALGISLGAAFVFPVVMTTLHWLRWLIDIPAMFAADARLSLLTALLDYVSGVFIHCLILGWVALAVWYMAATHTGWAALAWGYAVVATPLLLIMLRPSSYPLLAYLIMLAQVTYPLAWLLIHFGLLESSEVLAGIAVLALLSPLIQFSRRWQVLTSPD